MSLLFSVRPPLKSDVSALLQPSLGELLVVCRKYQTKKQESKSRPPSESEQQQQQPSTQDKEESSGGAKTDGEEEPVKKRRRTLEGEEQAAASKATTGPSIKPGTSKDESTATTKKDKAQESSHKQSQKTGSIWGARPPTDWVDSLVKAIQSTITKVPA